MSLPVPSDPDSLAPERQLGRWSHLSGEIWLHRRERLPLPLVRPEFALRNLARVRVCERMISSEPLMRHHKLLIILAGEYPTRCRDSRIVLAAGDALLCPPGTSWNDDVPLGTHYYSLRFTCRGLGGTMSLLRQGSDVRTWVARGAWPALQPWIERIIADHAPGDPWSAVLQEPLVARIAWEYLRVLPPGVCACEPRADVDTEAQAADLRDAVTGAALARESVASLAGHLGVPVRTLDARCRRLLGAPPGNLLRAARLRRAAELLAAGTAVKAVANSLGFTTLSSFSRAFLTEYGCPPSRWRSEGGAPAC